MTTMIGTYWNVPRLVVPAALAHKWKQEAAWVRRRAVAARSKAPLSLTDDGFALSKALGAVGWLPTASGGVFVGWLDAQRSGTGVLADAKLAAIVAALRASRWRRVPGRVRGQGKHVVAHAPLGVRRRGDWLAIELPAGDYTVDAVAAHKTPLGKLAFVRLTRGGADATAPDVAKPTAAVRTRARELNRRARALAWVETDGGPILCLPEARRAAWRGPEGGDYDRACDVHEVALIRVGDGHAIVLGHPSATWVDTGKREGILVQGVVGDSKPELLDAALANAANGRWKRVGHLQVVTGGLAIHDAAKPGARPGRRRVRFELPPGRYLVEHRRAASATVELSLVRLRVAPAR